MSLNSTNAGRVVPLPSDDDLYGCMFEECMNMFSYEIGDDSYETSDDTYEISDTNKKLKEDDVLKVKWVDLNIERNSRDHHTDKFELTTDKKFLIVRRGQKFEINLDFNRDYDKSKDDIRLVFKFGKIPRPSKGTHVDLILSDEDKPKEWQAKILEKPSTDESSKPEVTKVKSLKLEVTTPPTCPVGKWQLDFDVIKKTDTRDEVHKFKQKKHMYIIFNPWCEDDQVYLSEKSLLDEYVLNEYGEIFVGSYYDIGSKRWYFGQFKDVVLDCCLYLLDKEMLSNRGDSVMVSRKISALVNQCDDNGVLIGNWSGKYEGGKSPLKWGGSHAILEKYYEDKSPVKYGQCWVFSGLVTTVCRALGIPARSVTNFASAHDTDKSVTIDNYINEDGEPLARLNGDSVWNFHVWNDVWMSRLDLGNEFERYKKAGWQALDATPQEESQAKHESIATCCMGPMPLEAIKNGDLTVPYDGKFVFAEVNADKEFWMMKKNSRMFHIETKRNKIGKNISTKSPFVRSYSWRTDSREDITDQYKFQEGSEEERKVVRKVEGKTGEKSIAEKDIAIDVRYKEDTLIGDDLLVKVNISNRGKERLTVHGNLSLDCIKYTGTHHWGISRIKLEETVIESETDVPMDFTYKAEEYLDKFRSIDHFNFRLFGCIVADKTEKCAIDTIDGRFVKPDLTVKAITTTTPTVGSKYEVKVSFENPLNKPLTECYISLDGPIQAIKDRKLKDQKEKSTIMETVEMFPTSAGEIEVIIKFNSLELTGIEGSIAITVSK